MPPLEQRPLSLSEFVGTIGELAMDEEWDRVTVALVVLSVIVKSGKARLQRPALVDVFPGADGAPLYRINESQPVILRP